MILYLMRRNLPEPLALIVCAFVTFAIFGAPQIALLVGAPFLFIAWTAVTHRASAFEATMPIRGRDIVAARAFWQLAVLAPPVFACLYAALMGNRSALPVNLILDAAVVTALAILLPYAIRPEEIEEPPFLLTGGVWIALGASSLAILHFLPPDLALDVLLIVAAVTARVIWVRIPASLEVAPRRASIARPAKFAMGSVRSTRELIPRAWRPLVHAFAETGTKAPTLLLFYLVAFGYGAMGPGHAQPFMVVYFAVPMATLRRNTSWLTAFPISRRARLWVLLVPTLVVGLSLFALGRVTRPFLPREDPMTVRAPDASPDFIGTRVPLEFWLPSSAKALPIVVSPWGESTLPDTISILHGVFYNPYSSTAANSTRFTEWQFERATQAVFGQTIESEKYERFRAAKSFPSTVLESTRMRTLIGAAILAGVLLSMSLSEMSYSYRTVIRWKGTTILQYVMTLVLVGSVFGGIFYSGRGMSDLLSPVLLRAFLRLSDLLPINIVAFTVIVAFPVLSSYSLLEWQFGRSELRARAAAPKWARVLERQLPFFR